ncbi:MAG: glycosyltransferase [Xanthomonadales bacterium]|nr:glycosyltransferase [Xanthomonadales bacterium]
MNSPLSVCHVVPNINTQSGGPAVSVPGLVDSLAAAGVETTLVTLNYARHGPQTALRRTRLVSMDAGPLTRMARGWKPSLQAELGRIAGDGIELVHNHGLWMFPNRYARVTAHKGRMPLVTSPRGMLEPWSLQRSPLKKKLVWLLMEQANLRAAHGFHATSEQERLSIRRVGMKQPVAVIPNGLDSQPPSAPSVCDLHPQLKHKKWCLFLGRLHPKKGLDLLLQSWKAATVSPDWHLVIAGPDLTGYRPGLEAMIQQLGLTGSVSLVGMLDQPQKRSALAGASLLVLPSHSENFGIVVAEALMAGVPAVATTGTPWEVLEKTGAGWWIEATIPALTRTLASATQLDSAELRRRGQAGKRYAEAEFAWDVVARKMVAFYRFLLGRGEQPEFVEA